MELRLQLKSSKRSERPTDPPTVKRAKDFKMKKITEQTKTQKRAKKIDKEIN